ncbi:MAG: hypothetical protein LBD41_00185, partial [Clostridiales Family XIII bacterium]|nr:hypothetical protein [Clostridiales Family XIII bacterium]
KEIEKLIYSGRTLSQKDILDIATISENRDIEFDVDKIKNKEIRTILLEKIVENQTHQIWRKTPFFSNKDKNHKRSQIIVILAALGIIACLLLLISCGKSAKNEKFGNFKDKPTVDIKNVLYKEFNYNKEDFYVLSEEQDGNIYTLLLSYKTLPDDKIISRETDMPAGELFYLSMKKKDYDNMLAGTTIFSSKEYPITVFVFANTTNLGIRSYGYLSKDRPTLNEVYNNFSNAEIMPITNGVSTDSNMTKEEFNNYVIGFSPFGESN